MFVAIEPLLRNCTKLSLSLQMKGDEMIVCVMPQGTANDVAMLQPLALAAPAAELDAGFADALAAYTGAHASLAEQVAATTAILEAAKTTQVSKATKTLAKGTGKFVPPASGRASSDGDDDDSDDEKGDDENSDNNAQKQSTASAEASTLAPAAAEPADTGTNLASLFD
jgi:PRTRC genetic system protein E